MLHVYVSPFTTSTSVPGIRAATWNAHSINGSVSDCCALQEELYKCIDTIQYPLSINLQSQCIRISEIDSKYNFSIGCFARPTGRTSCADGWL